MKCKHNGVTDSLIYKYITGNEVKPLSFRSGTGKY